MPARLTVVLLGELDALRKTGGTGFRVGGSLTALTVSRKLVLAVATPSLTVRVIKVVPN